ncbi:MAG: EAL domain-containing protein [Gammaproteobacteria bacterium]|jgi:EAL domain-containing protein (putative c-di-GMP-specific phosphodiesterase class I)
MNNPEDISIGHHSPWYLEGYVGNDKISRRYSLNPLPMRIGRLSEADIVVPLDEISGMHAEIEVRGEELWLRDLNSSNGTFHNRQRVCDDVRLSEGDVLHFSSCEFVLRKTATATSPDFTATRILQQPPELATYGVMANIDELRRLIDARQVMAFFQPIVMFTEPHGVAFEILGRGNLNGLPFAPDKLLDLAARIGAEEELTNLFRQEGIAAAANLADETRFYVNTHPAEVESGRIMSCLRQMREAAPSMLITVETHERLATDPAEMRELRAALSDLDMQLAYDDFGAGQARLLELVEVPPDVLKFDICLIRNIDKAPAAQQTMLQTLVKLVKDLGVSCLAEGVETRAELDVCLQMGFELVQGYYLGKPAPLHRWLGETRRFPSATEFLIPPGRQ